MRSCNASAFRIDRIVRGGTTAGVVMNETSGWLGPRADPPSRREVPGNAPQLGCYARCSRGKLRLIRECQARVYPVASRGTTRTGLARTVADKHSRPIGCCIR